MTVEVSQQSPAFFATSHHIWILLLLKRSPWTKEAFPWTLSAR